MCVICEEQFQICFIGRLNSQNKGIIILYQEVKKIGKFLFFKILLMKLVSFIGIFLKKYNVFDIRIFNNF